jgi:hypothetical protein
MITEFKSGHSYRYLGPYKRGDIIPGWNPEGHMDFMLDRKWHKCKKGDGPYACFYDSVGYTNRDWYWGDLDLFKERVTIQLEFDF